MTRPESVNIGDAKTLYVDWEDADGAPTNSTTVLTLTSPAGVVTTYNAPTNPSTGRYEQIHTWAAPAGTWLATWTATGTIAKVEKRKYYVRQVGEV